MKKQEFLDNICSKCKAFCCSERAADKENKCPKIKPIAMGWDAAAEAAETYLEENIFTKYDYDYITPKEDGIQGEFNDKWELIDDFRKHLN